MQFAAELLVDLILRTRLVSNAHAADRQARTGTPLGEPSSDQELDQGPLYLQIHPLFFISSFITWMAKAWSPTSCLI